MRKSRTNFHLVFSGVISPPSEEKVGREGGSLGAARIADPATARLPQNVACTSMIRPYSSVIQMAKILGSDIMAFR